MIIIAEDSPEYLFDLKEIAPEERQRDTAHKGSDGSLEEMLFATEATRRGYTAMIPWGHCQKADVAIWRPPFRPLTVQVKKAAWRKTSQQWHAYAASARGGRDKRLRRQDGREVDPYRRYKAGDFDILAVYVPTADAFRFYALKDIAGILHVTFRDLSTLNNWHVIEDALKHDL